MARMKTKNRQKIKNVNRNSNQIILASGYPGQTYKISFFFLHGTAQNVLLWNSTKAAKVFSPYDQENYVLQIVYVGIYVSQTFYKFCHRR